MAGAQTGTALQLAAATRASSLTAEELAGVAELAAASTAQSTREAYWRDWRRFESWLNGRGGDQASAELVALYLQEHAKLRKASGEWAYTPATLSRWASSINAAARSAGATPPGHDPLVRDVLAGIRRTRKTRQRKREPLLLEDLRRVLEVIEAAADSWAARLLARRDAAVLLTAWAGAFRRSELASLDGADVTWRRGDGLHVLLRSSKADQEGEGQVKPLPFGEDPLTCPVCAVGRWTEVTGAWDSQGRAGVMRLLADRSPEGHACHDGIASPASGLPLFRSVHRAGLIRARAMSGHAINEMVGRRAAEAGLDPYERGGLGGHSPRAGFVTEAFRAGASAEQIARQTGHGSMRSLDGYRRERDPLRGNAVTQVGL